MNVKITPKSKRAKDRVNQHGGIMEIIREDKFQGGPSILVRSISKTWSGKQKWQGWFTENEISFEIING